MALPVPLARPRPGAGAEGDAPKLPRMNSTIGESTSVLNVGVGREKKSPSSSDEIRLIHTENTPDGALGQKSEFCSFECVLYIGRLIEEGLRDSCWVLGSADRVVRLADGKDDDEEGRRLDGRQGDIGGGGERERQTIRVPSGTSMSGMIQTTLSKSSGVTLGGLSSLNSTGTALSELTLGTGTPVGGVVVAREGDGGKEEAVLGAPQSGEVAAGGVMDGLSGLDGSHEHDGGRSESDGTRGLMGRKSRWGPAVDSAQVVQSDVKIGGQGVVKINDKVLPLQHRWSVILPNNITHRFETQR